MIPQRCVDSCEAAGYVDEELRYFKAGGEKRFDGERRALQELRDRTKECKGDCVTCPLGGIIATKAFMQSREAIATAQLALAIAQEAENSPASATPRSDFWDYNGSTLG